MVGSRLAEMELVQKTIEASPILLEFEEGIYQPENTYLIPSGMRDRADQLAEKLYSDYVAKYKEFGVTPENAVEFVKSGLPGASSNKMVIYDIENEWNTWRVHAIAEDKNGEHNEREGKYLPPSVVAYHELMHVEETAKRAPKSEQKVEGVELLTATKTLILNDIIYKQLHDIPIDKVVDYGLHVKLGGNEIPLGEVANKYRELEQKYGNLAAALTSTESIAYLAKCKLSGMGKSVDEEAPAVQKPNISEIPSATSEPSIDLPPPLIIGQYRLRGNSTELS